MEAAMWALIQENDLCVLATQGEDGPHCSLMSYLTGPTPWRIFLLTGSHTTKFRNVLARPRVGLLVDDRERTPQRSGIKALSAEGTCRPLVDQAQIERWRARFMEQRPALIALSQDSDTRILEVSIHHVLLLDGVQASFSLNLA